MNFLGYINIEYTSGDDLCKRISIFDADNADAAIVLLKSEAKERISKLDDENLQVSVMVLPATEKTFDILAGEEDKIPHPDFRNFYAYGTSVFQEM